MCRKVKSDHVTATTKILEITAYHEDDTRARVLGAGADSFPAKPFQLTGLRFEVERLLSTKRLLESSPATDAGGAKR